MTVPNPGWVPGFVAARLNESIEAVSLSYAASAYFESTMNPTDYADYLSALEDALDASNLVRGKI